ALELFRSGRGERRDERIDDDGTLGGQVGELDRLAVDAVQRELGRLLSDLERAGAPDQGEAEKGGCNETPEHKTCVHGSPFRMVVQQRNQDAPSPVPRTPSRVSGWLRGVNLAATIRYRAVTRCTMARPFGVALVAPHWDGETGGSD